MSNTRIGIRIPTELRERIDKTIKAGKFKDLSELTRKALEEFLKDLPKKDQKAKP